MKTDENEKVCYHIMVPAAQEDGSAVLFEFMCKHVAPGDPTAVDSRVQIWLPKEVLESWANSMPQILADLGEMERQAKDVQSTGKN